MPWRGFFVSIGKTPIGRQLRLPKGRFTFRYRIEANDQHVTGRKRRVLIIDDHPLMLQALAGLLTQEVDFVVVGQAERLNDALPLLAQDPPDLVLLDLTLEGEPTLDSVRVLKEHAPAIKILIYSGHDEAIWAEKAIRAGASGYVQKEQRPALVIEALRKIAEGGLYVSANVQNRMLQKMSGSSEKRDPEDMLSDRELEIFGLYGQGLGTAEIAGKLHLSIKTVDAHRQNIKDKLKLRTAPEFNYAAFEWYRSRR